MPTRTSDVFLLEDLEAERGTTGPADRDHEALRAVGDWVRSFILRPHDQHALADELRRLPWNARQA